jgi:hypothetical protein
MSSVLRVGAGILAGIPVLILAAWIVAQVGQGRLLLAALVVVGLFIAWSVASWLFLTARGAGRWARRQ